jgi:hypothetical protein
LMVYEGRPKLAVVRGVKNIGVNVVIRESSSGDYIKCIAQRTGVSLRSIEMTMRKMRENSRRSSQH